MNKKIISFVLPAIMALSICAILGHISTQPRGKFFKEEADACSKVFGNEEDAIKLKRTTPLRSVAEDLVEPRVGVQYRAKYNIGTAQTPDWRVAVRFIAEIKTLDVDVTWTRSIYQPDGTRLGSEATYATTKAYTSLNSNNEDITPSAGFNYFVVYTLYDIPFESVDDYYIVAYATLSDTASSLPSVNSKAIAAQIGGNQQFAFDINRTGYFLTDCSNRFVDEDNPTRNSNLASFTLNLDENESFLIVKNDRSNSKFQVWDSSCLTYDGNSDVLNSFTNSEGRIKATESGKFALYLNNDGHLYRHKYTKSSPYYVVGPAVSNVENDWTFHSEYKCDGCPSEDNDICYILNLQLNVGDFCIANDTWTYQWAYWGYKAGGGIDWLGQRSPRIINGDAKDNFEDGSATADGTGNKNIHCKVAGRYNLYLTDDNYIYVSEANVTPPANQFSVFRQVLESVDLNIDLMDGFSLSQNQQSPRLMQKRNARQEVDGNFDPNEYGIHHLEDERDYNIYSSVVDLQYTLDPLFQEWIGLVADVKANATDLGEYVYQEMTYNLSLADEETGLITFVRNEPSTIISYVYDYEQSQWIPITLAEWGSTSYELYFKENEYTIHTEALNITTFEGHGTNPLITDEFLDNYVKIELDGDGNYSSVMAVISSSYSNQEELTRSSYHMYRKNDAVYYIWSDQYPEYNFIDTSFVSFIGSLAISYNVRTCPGEVVNDEYCRSWAFLENESQFFWTLQVGVGTSDGLKFFPEYNVHSISPRVTNTVQTVYYPADWFDPVYDPEYVSSYPAPDWLTSFIGMPMRAIVTPEGTFDAIQDTVCYVDSLGMTAGNGVIIPGRDEIAGYFSEEDNVNKLYDVWSAKVDELGLSINEEYNSDFMQFLRQYSFYDLFSPSTMRGLCDYDYVKDYLNELIVNYQNAFEPSILLGR